MHIAAENKNADFVKLLLKSGADPNLKNNLRISPLHVSAKLGARDVAEALLEQGADVNLKGQYSRTPLTEAILAKQTEFAKWLFNEKKADPRIPDDQGVDSLQHASDSELPVFAQ